MLDLNTLRVDPTLASAGTWVKFSGAEFLIARYNNRAAENARALLSLEFYTELSKKDGEVTEADEKAFQEIQNKVMSEHILKDWKNVGAEGKELKFSPAVAFTILNDEGHDDLRQFIQNEALKRENFVAKEIAAVEKDVKPSADS